MQAELEEQQQRKHEAALTDQVHPRLLWLALLWSFSLSLTTRALSIPRVPRRSAPSRTRLNAHPHTDRPLRPSCTRSCMHSLAWRLPCGHTRQQPRLWFAQELKHEAVRAKLAKLQAEKRELSELVAHRDRQLCEAEERWRETHEQSANLIQVRPGFAAAAAARLVKLVGVRHFG